MLLICRHYTKMACLVFDHVQFWKNRSALSHYTHVCHNDSQLMSMEYANEESIATAINALKITCENKNGLDGERIAAFDMIFAKGAEQFKKEVDTKLSQRYVEMYAKRVFCMGVSALEMGSIETPTKKWKLYENVRTKSTQTVKGKHESEVTNVKPVSIDLEAILAEFNIQISGRNKRDFWKLSPSTIRMLGARCVEVDPDFKANYVLQNGRLTHGKTEPTKADWIDGIYRYRKANEP